MKRQWPWRNYEPLGAKRSAQPAHGSTKMIGNGCSDAKSMALLECVGGNLATICAGSRAHMLQASSSADPAWRPETGMDSCCPEATDQLSVDHLMTTWH